MAQQATTAPGALDLEALDGAVEAAIAAADPGALRVLGYGELTLVLGWPTDGPALAVKRLPVFQDVVRLERYEALVHRYVGELRDRGVPVVPTGLRCLRASDGTRHAYLVQPLLRGEAFLDHVLVAADDARGAVLLDTLAERVAAAVDDRLGLDAQVANWAVLGDDLSCVDVSTPLLRDAHGRDQLDLELFLSVYPWALRPALRHIAHDVMAQYHDPRTVLLDVASNLHKERLDRWVPVLLRAANAHVAPPIDAAEVDRYFARDRRLWLAMQRLRRADRAWQRHVRRRPYPFLLAPPYAYGPPELPEERP